jgi:hypothetical protein
MAPVLALALQVAAAAAPSTAIARIDFDLARYVGPDFEAGFGTQNCHRSADPAAITVCGRRGGGAYPLERMARIYGPRPIVADVPIAGNLRGGIRMRSVDLDVAATPSSLPHDISNRILVGVRLPF